MKKAVFIGMVSLIFAVSGFSQEFAPIVVQKKGLGTSYMQNDQRLNGKELQSLLKANPLSAKEYKMASINSTIGSTMLAGGALVIGLSSFLSSLEDVNDLNSGSLPESNGNSGLLIGSGIAILGIPFLIMGKSHLVKSIDLFNSHNTSLNKTDIYLDMGISQNGIGVKLIF